MPRNGAENFLSSSLMKLTCDRTQVSRSICSTSFAQFQVGTTTSDTSTIWDSWHRSAVGDAAAINPRFRFTLARAKSIAAILGALDDRSS